MRRRHFFTTVFAAMLGLALCGTAARAADDTIKIGYIDRSPEHSPRAATPA
jgi:hypothetical protein